MSDTPEEMARKKQLLEEIWELEKQIEQDLVAKGITRVWLTPNVEPIP